ASRAPPCSAMHRPTPRGPGRMLFVVPGRWRTDDVSAPADPAPIPSGAPIRCSGCAWRRRGRPPAPPPAASDAPCARCPRCWAPYSMASTASRVRSVVGWWGVQADGQMPPVPREVLVRSEDRRMGTVGERAEQHVDRRPDDAVRAARVEERRCAIIVTELDGEHCECGEALPERFEVGLALHAREHLL